MKLENIICCTVHQGRGLQFNMESENDAFKKPMQLNYQFFFIPSRSNMNTLILHRSISRDLQLWNCTFVLLQPIHCIVEHEYISCQNNFHYKTTDNTSFNISENCFFPFDLYKNPSISISKNEIDIKMGTYNDITS